MGLQHADSIRQSERDSDSIDDDYCSSDSGDSIYDTIENVGIDREYISSITI